MLSDFCCNRLCFQLLTGASDDLLRRLNISRSSDQYFYISQGNAARVDSLNDKFLYRDMTTSLNTLQVSYVMRILRNALNFNTIENFTCIFSFFQFSKEDQDTLWRVVAAILHLGNVEFDLIEDKLELKKSKHVDDVASLLQVSIFPLFEQTVNLIVSYRI